MAMSPRDRALKVQEIQDQYGEFETIPLVREYLKYEHAKNKGIKTAHDSPGLREMVDIYYDALRELCIERFKTGTRFDRLMSKARGHLLEPFHYTND